jgi:carbon-monoxide dehydrogenase medium subunit
VEGRTRIRLEPLIEGEKTMQAFAYSNPASVADAAKGAAGANAKILAGGQSLLPAMKLGLAAPESLVDLGQIAELKGISVSGNVVKIGAMTTHAAVAASADVQRAIPALADLAGHIGDRQVRNRGTIGGSLANNDPAACYPAAVLGLGATVHTNARDIKADDFFTGLYETALNEGEIITAVSFPVPEKAAWQKFKQPASRFSLVGVFVSKGSQGVRVAVTGAGACVFRASSLESKLQGNWSGAALEGATFPADGLNTDLHGSADYRAALIPVLAQRAVAAS